jgi:hypothetical protein
MDAILTILARIGVSLMFLGMIAWVFIDKVPPKMRG